jgi:hypothetical protein
VTFEAAREGDFDAFRDGFTRRSGNVLDGLLAHSEHGSKAFVFGPFAKAPEIVGERRIRELVVIDTRMDGLSLPFPLVLERGRWRIDLHALEELWYRFGSGPFASSAFDDPLPLRKPVGDRAD